MDKAKAYIDEHKERFVGELFELLRIPSVSAQSVHAPDVVRCAELLAGLLVRSGADRAEVMPTEGNPIVYAEKIVDPAAKTVLVYGHYDVMPVDPLEGWKTDPFEPVIEDGRIRARGADDDKGQLYMHVKALETMLQTGTLGCNVKFMIEGEEEIGSGGISRWCGLHRELLRADIILVSDTSLLSWKVPSITCGLRGLCYVEVEVTGPNRDLHSGLYGGAVANPINVLSGMIASLIDAEGRITIPGFYDGIRELAPQEHREFAAAPFCEAAYCKSLGILETQGEKGYTTLERIVKVRVKMLHGGAPYVSPTDLPAYRAASAAFEQTFGRKPVPFYSGGSIPVISVFEKELGVKSILMGFGLDEDAIHSPNESYPLANFYRGIETIVRFYANYTAMETA